MKSSISKIFLRGFVAMLPLLITLFLLAWLFQTFDSTFAKPIKVFTGEQYYYPGMGLVLALVVIFCIGLALNAWVTRMLFQRFDEWLSRTPLIKSLYGAVKDLMGFFVKSDGQKQSQVVTVTLGNPPMRLLGLVTREHFDDLPPGIGGDGVVAVYLPMSYQLGGFTVMIPRSAITPIAMSTEEAPRFAVTAGMTAKKSDQQKEAPRLAEAAPVPPPTSTPQ